MVVPAFITTLVTSTVKPLIQKVIAKDLTEISESIRLAITSVSESFGDYLARLYKAHSVLNTIVFSNQQKQLKDLYVPLTLTDLNGNGAEEYRIDSFPDMLLDKYHRVLIRDTAGMGKSTLVKYMFLSAIDGQKNYPIPLYIELRRLNRNHTLIDEVQNQLGAIDKEFDKRLLLEFFREGRFVFFLDGFDEILSIEKEIVTRDLHDFIFKAPDNYYILTSRNNPSLKSFGDFKLMKIKPLVEDEVYKLLSRYDNSGIISTPLIATLKAGEYLKVRTFMENPLLVSLLFVAYDFRKSIPLQKHIFYEQVFESFFDVHDLSKDSYVRPKVTRMNKTEFRLVLRAIGMICLTKDTTEFSKSEFVEVLEKARLLAGGLKYSTDNLMKDLLENVPLFCSDDVYYRWAHKSLQEFFAAEFISCDNNKELILSKILNSKQIENYSNFLDLFSEIDSFNYDRYIVMPVMSDYVSFKDTVGAMNDSVMHLLVLRLCEMVYGREIFLYLPTISEQRWLAEEQILRSRCYKSSYNNDSHMRHVEDIMEEYRKKKEMGSMRIKCQLEQKYSGAHVLWQKGIKGYSYFIAVRAKQKEAIVRFLLSKNPDLQSNNHWEAVLDKGILKRGEMYCVSEELLKGNDAVTEQIVLLLEGEGNALSGINYYRARHKIKEIQDRIRGKEDALMDQIDYWGNLSISEEE